jgi:hypothetical protein
MEDFKSKQTHLLLAGCIKFSLDYISRQQVYEFAKEWAAQDSKVIMATMRGGGNDQEAIDFRYDAIELGDGKGLGSRFLDMMREKIKAKFGSDSSLIGWDFANDAIVLK